MELTLPIIAIITAAALVLLGVFFLATRLHTRTSRQLPPDGQTPASDDVAAVGRDGAETSTATPVRPRIATLGDALARSRGLLGGRLSAVFSRPGLDKQVEQELEEALILADVGMPATQRILESLRRNRSQEDLRAGLRTEMLEMFSQSDVTLRLRDGGLTVWLVVGVNGAGKTTSIGKLAHRLIDGGRSVVLAAADTFRPAASEQLAVWAERNGVHIVAHQQGGDPAAVVFDALAYATARGVDVVLVDTAGRLHTKEPLMEELKKIRRVVDREPGALQEVLLVLDATTGQNGLVQARAFKDSVGATGIILTKLDGTARGGIVIAVQQELGIPVKVVGVGEGLEDLVPFDKEVFVDALLDTSK